MRPSDRRNVTKAPNRQDARVRDRCSPGVAVNTADHHSAYLARAVANLSPEGRKRVDELLDQLAVAGGSREWVVRFTMAREAEADAGRTDTTAAAEEPGQRLGKGELDVLITGFMTIRDQEPLDD